MEEAVAWATAAGQAELAVQLVLEEPMESKAYPRTPWLWPGSDAVSSLQLPPHAFALARQVSLLFATSSDQAWTLALVELLGQHCPWEAAARTGR